ncbi:MAG: small ribosomal subunit Rsm22 family protein [Actinomycetota bacterium]
MSHDTLASASARLTSQYRAGTPPTSFTEIEAAAYATVRAPATHAAASAVLGEVASRVVGFEPGSLVDLGAGTGATTEAALGVWPSIGRLDLFERSETMIAASQAKGTWHRGDITGASFEPADVVCAAYSLGELSSADRDAVLRRAWEATTGVLIVIEPGTRSGFATILGVRDALIEVGAELLAPCPHMDACPMPEGKWCHFPVRLERSESHRRVKDVDLPYEDERFSYVAFSRIGGSRAEGRVVGHPRYPRRRVALEVCASDGLRAVTVPKSSDRYREAKMWRWGSAVPRRP